MSEETKDVKEDLKPKEGEVYKVVITSAESRSLVGVMKPGCDPVMATVEGGWEAALKEMPRLMDEAVARWQKAPQYPRYDRPAAPPPAATQPAPRTASRPATPSRRGQEKVEEYKLL